MCDFLPTRQLSICWAATLSPFPYPLPRPREQHPFQSFWNLISGSLAFTPASLNKFLPVTCDMHDISVYYSTNCNTIQIWSWCSRYLSSAGNRYPAIYVASYVGKNSEVKKCRQKDLKMLQVLLSICWIIKQLSCSISRNIVWFQPTRPTASSAKYQTIFRAISQDNC